MPTTHGPSKSHSTRTRHDDEVGSSAYPSAHPLGKTSKKIERGLSTPQPRRCRADLSLAHGTRELSVGAANDAHPEIQQPKNHFPEIPKKRKYPRPSKKKNVSPGGKKNVLPEIRGRAPGGKKTPSRNFGGNKPRYEYVNRSQEN